MTLLGTIGRPASQIEVPRPSVNFLPIVQYRENYLERQVSLHKPVQDLAA